MAGKVAFASAAPASTVADRLSYNASSGKTVQGRGELLDALKEGSVKLEEVKKANLPAEYQKLDAAELEAKVAASNRSARSCRRRSRS